MNKEIKDRLDKLENELKESKNEIHSLKSSVSLTIERGIRKLLSRFTRNQLILGSVIALFLISIIGIAGTVTKTYIFSSGDVVSASKINTNFDTLYTLVNGNLDDGNISGISGSKITSGTVAAARIDNLDGSKITSGTIASSRIGNLDGSKITSGTIASSRIGNLDGSKITSGTIASSRIDSQDNDSIIFYSTRLSYNGNLGGRSGADLKCANFIDRQITRYLSSCQNVRSVLSVSGSDEVRDMKNNYSIPDNYTLRGPNGFNFADSWDTFVDSNLPFSPNIQIGTGGDGSNRYYWYSTSYQAPSEGQVGGLVFGGDHCNNWTSSSSSVNGTYGRDISGSISNRGNSGSPISCDSTKPLICICW